MVRRLAAVAHGDDPETIAAEAGTRQWIETAARRGTYTRAVPSDRAVR